MNENEEAMSALRDRLRKLPNRNAVELATIHLKGLLDKETSRRENCQDKYQEARCDLDEANRKLEHLAGEVKRLGGELRVSKAKKEFQVALVDEKEKKLDESDRLLERSRLKTRQLERSKDFNETTIRALSALALRNEQEE